MRILILVAFLSVSFLSFSQYNFSKEISLLSDNDLYTSVYRDRYYTNGLFFTYRNVTDAKNKSIAKRIHEYQIGHMMYTPIKATLPFANLHDRPFAAYFYGSYGFTNFYKSQNLFQINVEIGAIGPNAKGQELQDFMHSIYNYPKAEGWKHQIHNAFALNLNMSYLHNFKKISSSAFDVSSYSSFKIGTIFTNLTTGIYSRIGIKELQKISNSVAFHSNLNTNSKSYKESFIYIKPTITYAVYDATIQGSFLSTNSPVTYELKPFYFTLELGYKFYKKRFTYGYSYFYHTKKLKSIRATKTNTYGSVYVGYYFN